MMRAKFVCCGRSGNRRRDKKRVDDLESLWEGAGVIFNKAKLDEKEKETLPARRRYGLYIRYTIWLRSLLMSRFAAVIQMRD